MSCLFAVRFATQGLGPYTHLRCRLRGESSHRRLPALRRHKSVLKHRGSCTYDAMLSESWSGPLAVHEGPTTLGHRIGRTSSSRLWLPGASSPIVKAKAVENCRSAERRGTLQQPKQQMGNPKAFRAWRSLTLSLNCKPQPISTLCKLERAQTRSALILATVGSIPEVGLVVISVYPDPKRKLSMSAADNYRHCRL